MTRATSSYAPAKHSASYDHKKINRYRSISMELRESSAKYQHCVGGGGGGKRQKQFVASV